MPATAPLNALDELYLGLDRAGEPFTVHLEVELDGRLDAVRLRGCVKKAARRHPLARARLAGTALTSLRHSWEIHDELDEAPLEVVECAGPEELGRERERHLAHAPSLERPGPFRLLLARGPEADTLILNLHHAAGDGLGAVRLMVSVLRAYAGAVDPLPAVDPLRARDVGALAGARSLADRLGRGRAALEYLGRGVARPARVARDGASGAPGYGFVLLELGPEELGRVLARRRGGATVNDVLVAALGVAVRRWNDRHEHDTGAAYLMMPVNLRPAAWREEVVGNFASYVSVPLAADDLAGLEPAIDATAARTQRIKRDGAAGMIVDLFGVPNVLPAGVKRRMERLIPLGGNLLVDTAVLSNLGRLGPAPALGDAGTVRRVWFSPPGRMPLGVSIGAATYEGRLFLTLRYRHAQFGAEAARAFAALLRETLLEG